MRSLRTRQQQSKISGSVNANFRSELKGSLKDAERYIEIGYIEIGREIGLEGPELRRENTSTEHCVSSPCQTSGDLTSESTLLNDFRTACDLNKKASLVDQQKIRLTRRNDKGKREGRKMCSQSVLRMSVPKQRAVPLTPEVHRRLQLTRSDKSYFTNATHGTTSP